MFLFPRSEDPKALHQEKHSDGTSDGCDKNAPSNIPTLARVDEVTPWAAEAKGSLAGEKRSASDKDAEVSQQ